MKESTERCGEKTLGIAESDIMGIIATGVENFRFESCDFDKAMERVKFYVKRDMIKEIALGLPLHMSGDESDHSIMCREFKDRIEKDTYKFYNPPRQRSQGYGYYKKFKDYRR